MAVLWVGAAAGVRLYDEDETTAWAGLYQLDWSIHGSGIVFALWRGDRVRVLGSDRGLSEWMNETFMGPMNRGSALGGVAWQAVEYEIGAVELEIEPHTGVRARVADIELELAGPLERELVYREAYVLDGHPYRMSFVNVPCEEGSVTLGGEQLSGRPRLWKDDEGRLRSTAQLALAESWAD